MPRPQKPKEILAGHAYRVWRPFRSGPSDQIAVVKRITHPTRTTRNVELEWLLPGADTNVTTYSHFMEMVYCEVALH
ncbi:hypothetical protein A9R05_42935 (plasmid) [Burkholderia sp. KK1]|nr:hypothetical protein A9R05_42935 [Burkholderia sp. KK1]